MISAAYVVLHLLVWDADTGTLLWGGDKRFDQTSFEISGSRIEDCRVWGVEYGRSLAMHYRNNGHPNAFANVDCEWRDVGKGNL
jgi:hypothetical protein